MPSRMYISASVEFDIKAFNDNHDDAGRFSEGGGGGAGSKPKPSRGEMKEARREGSGKDAKIVMSDGSDAPEHVKPGMVSPKWTDVKVSVDPSAEVLVTAKDDKGRPKQVMSKTYEAKAAVAKFNKIEGMLQEHEQIGQQIHQARTKPATKEEADVAFLMREQGTRVGSERDTKADVKAYGATTLEARHVVQAKDGTRLQFIGKEGIAHDHLIKNPELANMLVQRKQEAGHENEKIFKTNDTKVREFTGKLNGGDLTPKDFRSALATKMAGDLVKLNPSAPKTAKELKARIKDVATKVSRVLGNEPPEALKSYIHPAVFHSWSHAHA